MVNSVWLKDQTIREYYFCSLSVYIYSHIKLPYQCKDFLLFHTNFQLYPKPKYQILCMCLKKETLPPGTSYYRLTYSILDVCVIKIQPLDSGKLDNYQLWKVIKLLAASFSTSVEGNNRLSSGAFAFMPTGDNTGQPWAHRGPLNAHSCLLKVFLIICHRFTVKDLNIFNLAYWLYISR